VAASARDGGPPDPVEARTRELARAIREAEPRLPWRARLSDAALTSLVDRRELRAALFRFVDAAPACRGPIERGAHLRAYLRQVPSDQLPATLRALASPGLGAALVPAAGVLSGPATRLIARRFIAGPEAKAARRTLARAWRRGETFSLDLLGEATVTAAEADSYRDRCLAALDGLAELTAGWPPLPRSPESDRHGPIPRLNLSVKLTALTPLLRADAPERGAADAAERLRPLLRKANEVGAHLHLDVESLDTRETLLRAAEELLAEEEFRSGPSAGIVIQAYLRDAGEFLDRTLGSALVERQVPLTVRLVKGAYWEYERAEAGQLGWERPVWDSKGQTDRSYEELTRRLIDASDRVRPAIGSHNLRSLAHAIAYHEHRGGAPADLELQVLRGLGDSLAIALASLGRRVRVYTPVGDLVAGMAYLVRRLLENSSSQGFLLQERRRPLEELLQPPAPPT
jgi:RHH-type proline utilization regulon transcriptional repressor/proline dehydrogenase/delta 1-pyrroline-5-carboxylate dehydrogenase